MKTTPRASTRLATLLAGALALGTLSAGAQALEALVANEHGWVHDADVAEAYAGTADAVADFPHYAGAVNASAALRDRGFTLERPEGGDVLRIEGLAVSEIDGGYALASAPLAEGPTVDIVIIGAIVQGTVTVDYEDLYVVNALGEGLASVHRQDRAEGAEQHAHEHRHDHDHGHGHEHMELEPTSKARASAQSASQAEQGACRQSRPTPRRSSTSCFCTTRSRASARGTCRAAWRSPSST